MSKSPRQKKLTLLSVRRLQRHCLIAVSAAGLLLGLPVPARADLEAVVNTLPPQAVAAIALDLQPTSWNFLLTTPGLNRWLLSSEVAKLAAELKQELGIDFAQLSKGLGGHGMLAFYPNPADPEEPDW